ncbi:MFS transporter [Opitutus terrae]|uniref:Major facilitator superfamily MFS_1 n=1 Tax=Opitutus terrae (strain DSM 11246 / JCM 15787 / PB90-1) TaxID=452637 RepID=B1ZZX0_OPITP|nr:MFS transporter [Opitutus terrae]ACB77303.1 major facilitator superfamily MFS_1 [Opitutus terrae PB90-1]
MNPPAAAPQPSRPLSLGVIFLTLYIDLIGFSIIFPFVPDLMEYYLRGETPGGLLAWLLAQTNALAALLGNHDHLADVLFAGVLTSFFSILQFVFAPFWGALSDRRGRRSVLLLTVCGTAAGYALWVFSGSFWLFMLSRVICGAFGGNLSVATAAVADVTSRQERSRAMGLVGAAFGLGLVTGPMLGAISASHNLLASYPSLARFGINPFSVPALIALGMSLVNVVWIALRFRETVSTATRDESAATRLRNPLRAIFALPSAAVRRANLVAFIFSVAFVAMETSLTFLAAERFGYTARQNGMLMVFLGVCSIITQGMIVRWLLRETSELRVLAGGLIAAAAGLVCIGLAPAPWLVFVGLAFLATGSGLVNPSTTGLISLYSHTAEQGRALGVFRSLGSLSRAITPVCAGTAYWIFGGGSVFVVAAGFALAALWLSRTLPLPDK